LRTAYGGVAAKGAAADFLPHVIVLDIALQKLDGYQAAKQIRHYPELQTMCPNALAPGDATSS
jgi:CheY-like chemotaxis protein